MGHLQTYLTLTLASHARDNNTTLFGTRSVNKTVTDSRGDTIYEVREASEERTLGAIYGPVHIAAGVSGSYHNQCCFPQHILHLPFPEG